MGRFHMTVAIKMTVSVLNMSMFPWYM